MGVGTHGRIVIVAPAPPPRGGMALQAQLLRRLLETDGESVALFATNFALAAPLRLAEAIPGIRTALRFISIWPRLWRAVDGSEVVHVFAASWLYFFLAVYPAVVLGRLAGARVIVNYRGGDARRFFARWGWAAGPAFRLAAAVTAPSKFLVDIIGDRFHVPVQVVSNIIDTSAFRFRRRYAIAPRILTTRYLEKMYDVESVIRAFRVVQTSHPDASLLIAGTGSQENYLKELVAVWDLKNVRFLGDVPHDDLPRICDGCDILINASLVDNFPASLIEASAAGMVVISTAAGGIPAIYQNGNNALLVEPGDWRGLADAVEKVLESESLAQRLIREALVSASACSWQHVRMALYQVYGFAAPAEAALMARG